MWNNNPWKKLRNAHLRAKWWDYSRNGAYFITICTKNKAHFFGEIINGQMIFSNTGIIANQLWKEIPNHHDFIELGDFVIMPNHIHGIILINKPIVGSGHALNLQPEKQTKQLQHQQQPGENRFQNIGKNTISSVVGSFKSAVTKQVNRLGYPNGWQPLFYDHMIRDRSDYLRISEYIINNPKKWKNDIPP